MQYGYVVTTMKRCYGPRFSVLCLGRTELGRTAFSSNHKITKLHPLAASCCDGNHSFVFGNMSCLHSDLWLRLWLTCWVKTLLFESGKCPQSNLSFVTQFGQRHQYEKKKRNLVCDCEVLRYLFGNCSVFHGFFFPHIYPRIYQLSLLFITLFTVQRKAFSESQLDGYSLQQWCHMTRIKNRTQ